MVLFLNPKRNGRLLENYLIVSKPLLLVFGMDGYTSHQDSETEDLMIQHQERSLGRCGEPSCTCDFSFFFVTFTNCIIYFLRHGFISSTTLEKKVVENDEIKSV